MPKYNITRELPYSAKQLLEVALDVGSYKSFVPLVKESTVINRKTAQAIGLAIPPALASLARIVEG